VTDPSATVLELSGGHTLVVLGSEREVRTALDARDSYVGGMCLLRFAFAPELVSVEPSAVRHVRPATAAEQRALGSIGFAGGRLSINEEGT
jgi:hypothetical protein